MTIVYDSLLFNEVKSPMSDTTMGGASDVHVEFSISITAEIKMCDMVIIGFMGSVSSSNNVSHIFVVSSLVS